MGEASSGMLQRLRSRGSREQTPVFPGQTQAPAPTAAKMIKHRVYQVATIFFFLGELELAHTS